MCVFVCTLLKIKMMYYFFVDIKSAANHMLETCRVIVLFQYLHGDNVRIRLKSGPPLFVFVLVRLFRGLCKNPPKCKYIFNVSSFFFLFFFFSIVGHCCYLMIVGPLSLILFLSFVVVVSFRPHDDIKRGSVLSILCCSCSMIVVLFTAVPSSTRHICTDEIKKKCYLLFIVVHHVCQCTSGYRVQYFCLGKLYREKKNKGFLMYIGKSCGVFHPQDNN